MCVMASQITCISIFVYSTVCSGTDQRKHQSSTSLAFVRGIHRWLVNSPHEGPVTRKMFPIWRRHHDHNNQWMTLFDTDSWPNTLQILTIHIFLLAATKQLYEWFSPPVCPSVCLSVRLSHLFDYVPIIVSSWNFQELLPVTKVTSMQKVKVRGQRSRSQRSQPNLTVSGL